MSNCSRLELLGIGGNFFSWRFMDYVAELLGERRNSHVIAFHGHNSSITLANIYAEAELQDLPLKCVFDHKEEDHAPAPDLLIDSSAS